MSSRAVDELLDELLAHSGRGTLPAAEPALQSTVVARPAGGRPAFAKALRSKAVGRLGLLAAVPLSLAAVAVAVVMMVSARDRDDAARESQTPAADAPSVVAAPPNHPASSAPAPPVGIADAAFVGALRHEGVPLPSQDYVTAKGHAVCDFLAHQPSFADAADFVQRSSVWDADQSAKVTAGAIVAYCPQAQAAAMNQSQPTYQNTLSDLQAIEQHLQGIQGDLHGIEGSLDRIPGQS